MTSDFKVRAEHVSVIKHNLLQPSEASFTASALPTSSSTSVPTLTLTATPPATQDPYDLPPVTVLPYELSGPFRTPIPPYSPDFSEIKYTLVKEYALGIYSIRLWEPPTGEIAPTWVVVYNEQQTLVFDSVQGMDYHTGTDITGEGNPDLILRIGPLIFGLPIRTLIYDLGASPRLVLDTGGVNCHGDFEDLNNDGSLEYISCDSSFVDRFCSQVSYGGALSVKVIYKFTPGRGYVPDSPKFPEQYLEDIHNHLELAKNAVAGGRAEDDNTTKCSVLPVVLDYLYSGQLEAARYSLRQYYHYADINEFWQAIEQTSKASPKFVPATNGNSE